MEEKRAREDQRRKEEREEAARRKQSKFPPKAMIRYNGFGSTITLDLPVSTCRGFHCGSTEVLQFLALQHKHSNNGFSTVIKLQLQTAEKCQINHCHFHL